MTIATLAPATRYQIAAWLMTASGLLLILYLRLLPALLAGLLVVQLVHLLAPRFVIGKLDHTWSKVLVVSLITLIVLGALGGVYRGRHPLSAHRGRSCRLAHQDGRGDRKFARTAAAVGPGVAAAGRQSR